MRLTPYLHQILQHVHWIALPLYAQRQQHHLPYRLPFQHCQLFLAPHRPLCLSGQILDLKFVCRMIS
ncbi:MAG: hypothetical protein WDM76_08600 [Limisphaerales bacterium]